MSESGNEVKLTERSAKKRRRMNSIETRVYIFTWWLIAWEVKWTQVFIVTSAECADVQMGRYFTSSRQVAYAWPYLQKDLNIILLYIDCDTIFSFYSIIIVLNGKLISG